MLVCNDTPFFCGTKLTSRKPPAPEMTLVVRGTFRLVPSGLVEAIEGIEQDFLSGETFAEDDIDRSGEATYPGDFADFKLSGEVMLRGSCHTPRGKASSCPVRLSVGDWKKELIVYGDRRWKGGILGAKMTEPEPFESMPLDWAHAYGAPDHPDNPVGKGRKGDELPNVELPSAPIAQKGDAPPPAGFGPISSTWPRRAALRGKNYGGSYQKERAPFYADDFDWRYFSSAPQDQRWQGFFVGDERVVLQNLHPEHPVLDTRLPGIRVRVFVKDDAGSFREVPMSLDTVYFEPDRDRVKLTWRGVAGVREDDLLDVTHVLVVSERLDAEPQTIEAYRERLETFAADPTGVLAEIPPEMMAAYERHQKDKRGEPTVEPALDPDLDPVSGWVKATFGKAVPEQRLEALADGVRKLQASPQGGKADLAAMMARSRAAEKLAPPSMRLLKPGSLPPLGLKKQMRVLMEKLAELRQQEQASGHQLKGLEKLERIPHAPRLKELDPDYELPEPLSTDTPGPGADLRERDLSGKDLRGIDLSGANLQDADLSRANLSGAKLRGAKLSRAILHLANLDDADLTEADLRLCNAFAVRAERANFTAARMSEAYFEHALLAGAKLDRVTADYVVFERADLRGVSASAATFDHSDFSEAHLDKAKMKGIGAELRPCARPQRGLVRRADGTSQLQRSRSHRCQAGRGHLDEGVFLEDRARQGRLVVGRAA